MTRSNLFRSVLLSLVVILETLFSPLAFAENWPGWRGVHRNGISAETGIPTEWSETKNILWKTPLAGFGISNPIVWGNRVFVTASDGKNLANLHVACLDLDTGVEVWHEQFWGTAPTRHHNNKSSMASPAPVTDGEFIYAFFGTGDVFCLDFSGSLIWQRSLASEYGRFENRFAASSSPLLFQDLMILQCDHYGDSYLIALEKNTGDNRWKVDRPGYWLSWSSPLLVESKQGRPELIISGSNRLDAFQPTNGKKLWSLDGMRRECIPTPLFGNGLIYAVSGPKGPTMAIKPGGTGNVTDTHVVWSNNRGAPFVPSAILVGQHYYLVDDSGIATCLNALTGKSLWQKRFGGKFTASPISAEGLIYFSDESGKTTVVKAGLDKYQEVASNTVNEPVFASPAISQGRIFLRTARHLYCIGNVATD